MMLMTNQYCIWILQNLLLMILMMIYLPIPMVIDMSLTVVFNYLNFIESYVEIFSNDQVRMTVAAPS